MTSAIRAVLECDSRILPLTRAFADVPITDLPLDQRVELRDREGSECGLTVEAFEVPAGPPQFARTSLKGHTVGLLLRDLARGHTCAFVPACADLSATLLARLAQVDILLFDGTFWSDGELAALGTASRTAREMDHLPIAGHDGSLERLKTLPCRYRVYTHINNTNPVLLEHSIERAAVTGSGLTVGFDGLHITL
jgi:pyrroloquinoline quinone biosynthesis protein B